ncbi:MAG TPA: hypothetical protein VK808_02205 [Bacteroidia bacterium]|jgi:hypothetical protein|nr:hypothetical protein [Bacteroidia bacterium]
MLIAKKDILSTLAFLAINRAAYCLPWDFEEALELIDTEIDVEWYPKLDEDSGYFRFENIKVFEHELSTLLFRVDKFKAWGLSLNESTKEGVIVNPHRNRPEPSQRGAHKSDDFIDLDELIKGTVNYIMTTRGSWNNRTTGNATLSWEPDLPIECAINSLIKSHKVNTNEISDGYHTFHQLYEHRIVNYLTLAKLLATNPAFIESKYRVWKSQLHSDGSSFEGWFALGICEGEGDQITYHLPMSYWDKCWFAEALDMAPKWDGHSSQDVLDRLLAII